MINVTIDGKIIQTEPTKTIIDAAFENGIYIPHFSWHPSLSISGNCRMCLVEVEKMPKQVIACSTLCMDGMVVHVNSEKAVNARAAVMEFLLINHPLDCPICDEAGECKLQDYAYNYSIGESRFDEEKEHKRKRVPLGPNVVFDAERCISCSRCIRFCEDVVGSPQLTFVERGDKVTIVTMPGKQLDNPYSMNVIELCPVGALTSADFRFKARVWEMSRTESICPGCSRGCNTSLWVRKNRILRLTPRENQEVNNFWMCDDGRLHRWQFTHAETRVQEPSIQRDGIATPVSWDEALASVASELKIYRKDQFAVIGSGFDTCEDNYLLAKFARDILHTSNIDCLSHQSSGKQDEFLLRDDETPNSTGARFTGVRPDDPAHGIQGIIEGLNKGLIKAVIVTDNRADEHEGLLKALRKAQYVVAVVSNTSALTSVAHAVLAASTFAEKAGTFLNFEYQLQLLQPAVVTMENERWKDGFALSRLDAFGTVFDRWGKLPRLDARSTFRIVAHLANLFGAKWKFQHPEDVFETMARHLDSLAGITYETLGAHGFRIKGDKPAHALPYSYSDVHPEYGSGR